MAIEIDVAELERVIEAEQRRAVSPSAPEGLRDRIAEGVRETVNHYAKQVKWSDDDDRASFCDDMESDITDAVLAVLPTAPRVDVDAVMDLVDLFGHARANAATASNPESKVRLYDRATERFAAIRAMLEGTA